MLPQDNPRAYRELALSTRLPLCVSERLMTRYGFRELMENQAARIISFTVPDGPPAHVRAVTETWADQT